VTSDNEASPPPTMSLIGGSDLAESRAVAVDLPVPVGPVHRIDPRNVKGAFAANTRRAYRAAWENWMIWCGERGKDALRASEADVADYLRQRAERGDKMTTLRVRLAAITQARRLAGETLNRDAPELHFALKALAREYGIASKGKTELMLADIEAMLSVLRGDSLAAIRDRAILLSGFAGGFRRSELAALDVPDLEFRRDGLVVTLNRSKGDQEGRGQIVAIVYGRRERTCPVRAIKRWLDASGLTEGPLFRPMLRRGRVVGDHRLSDRGIYEVVKATARAAGLDAEKFGAHSLRSGHVTQALENGADPIAAQKQLRHVKLDTTLGYNRRGAALKGSSSGKLGL
jgi:site-specific recombinase XerD